MFIETVKSLGYVSLGYVKGGELFVKFIGYGAIIIDPNTRVIKSLLRSFSTGEVISYGNKTLVMEGLKIQIIEFELCNTKNTVSVYGPMSDIIKIP